MVVCVGINNPENICPKHICSVQQSVVSSFYVSFQKHGGSTIVENTTNGLVRDVKFLKEMAVASGVNILAGTGVYDTKNDR